MSNGLVKRREPGFRLDDLKEWPQEFSDKVLREFIACIATRKHAEKYPDLERYMRRWHKEYSQRRVAATIMYVEGMMLNDVFDYYIDTQAIVQAPHRKALFRGFVSGYTVAAAEMLAADEELIRRRLNVTYKDIWEDGFEFDTFPFIAFLGPRSRISQRKIGGLADLLKEEDGGIKAMNAIGSPSSDAARRYFENGGIFSLISGDEGTEKIASDMGRLYAERRFIEILPRIGELEPGLVAEYMHR